jgi:Ser/Thr protein kinase RdoA (MazF antagonist)
MGMERLLPHVAAERQPVVRAVLAEIAAILPAWRQLPAQTIHNDFNPFNILVDPGNHTAISGILDFGDMVHAPALNDLATAAAYLTDEPGLELYRAIIAGYASRRPLTPAEIGLLPSLTKARLILTICITEWRAAERPAEAAYILRNHPAANRGLINLQGHSAALLQALVANAAGARP